MQGDALMLAVRSGTAGRILGIVELSEQPRELTLILSLRLESNRRVNPHPKPKPQEQPPS